MLRKILFVTLLIAFFGGLAYYLFTLNKQNKQPVSEAVKAIPLNASLILETKFPIQSWKKLSSGNLIWDEFQKIAIVHDLNRSGRFLDSIITLKPELAKIFHDRSVFLSAHPSGAGKYDFLCVCNLPDLTYQSSMDNLVKEIFGNNPVSQRQYEQINIQTIKVDEELRYHFAFYKGVFMGSYSDVLVEDAIRQLGAGISLLSNKSFARVMDASGHKVDATLFIGFKSAPTLFAPYFNSGAKSYINSLSSFAAWASLDVTFKPNELLLSGFIHSTDSLNDYITLFSKQKAHEMEAVKILPSNTASFVYMGLSNFRSFRFDYKNYLEAKHRFFDYEQFIQQLNRKYDFNIEKGLLSWIDKEMIVAVNETAADNIAEKTLALFHASDPDEAILSINSLADTIVFNSNLLVADTTSYKGHKIRQFPLTGILPQLLGPPFDALTENFYMKFDSYIVFANSANALHEFIDHNESGKTLNKDKYYNSYMDGNMDNESSFFFYSAPGRSTGLYSWFLDPEMQEFISNNNGLFRKFQALGFQFTYHDDMYYCHASLKHNPVYKHEIASLWESQLNSNISTAPQVLVNHVDGTKEIFVQDDDHTIYLINNTGKILWKRKLNEAILGNVTQVDALKNKKLQMLFNTRSAIYLIDRNGNDVKGFPLKLTSHATAPIGVFDYEQSRDYRIIACCADGKVYNYKINGDKNSKWKIKTFENELKQAPEHVRINDIDYLLFIDNKGKVIITDKQGKELKELKYQLKNGKGKHQFVKGYDLEKCSFVDCDSSGVVWVTTFKDSQESFVIQEFESAPEFNYLDLDGDRSMEFVFADKNIIYVYNEDKKLRFSFELNNEISEPFIFYNLSNDQKLIGAVSSQANELSLLYPGGQMLQGFPLFGNTPFVIDQLNNTQALFLITGGPEGKIFVYEVKL